MNALGKAWHAVSGGSDLPPGSARAVLLLDRDIVIWRSEEGALRAWRNRCPHRGMRLSFAQVRGERLSCRYHGWLFDGSGQCIAMPAQPHVKPAATLNVPGYSCMEKDGLIWVNLEGAESTMPEDLKPENIESKRVLFCKSLYLDGVAETLAKKLTAARFPPQPDQPPAPSIRYRGTFCKPNLVRLAGLGKDGDKDVVMIALQRMTNKRTCLHLCTLGTGEPALDIERRLRIGRWGRDLRRFLQSQDAVSGGDRRLPGPDR